MTEGKTNHRMLLPEPAVNMRVSGVNEVESKIDVRLPWIHKREGDDFHCSKIPPWKNQDAVPLWCALRAILWFVDRSGGGSHFCSFSRNWLSVRINKPREATAVRSEYERFSSLVVSAKRCITVFASFTSGDIFVQEYVNK